MARFDLALKGGECVMPWGVVRADIGIRAGRIAAIGDLTQAEAAEVVAVLAGGDAILCAGNPTAAPRVVDVDEGPFRRSHPITGPFNATGHPGLALPCGFGASCLPLGLQLIGRSYGEAMLLRIAQAYEDVAGWLARRPELGG